MLAECRLFLRCEADCTFFPVEADRRAVEKMSDTAVGDHFVRRAVQEFAAVDHYDTVAKVECDVQVVRRKTPSVRRAGSSAYPGPANGRS